MHGNCKGNLSFELGDFPGIKVIRGVVALFSLAEKIGKHWTEQG